MSDGELGQVAPLVIDHERESTIFGFQMIDDDGDVVSVGFVINQLPTVNPDGSLVFDLPAGSPNAAEPLAACGNIDDGSLRSSIIGFHQKLVIRKLCDVGEPITGCFDTAVQLTDGSRCNVRGEFLIFRTNHRFPPF